MEVRFSVLRRIVLSVADLIVESAARAQMVASFVVRVDTWSKIFHRIEVWLEVMLSLSLTHRVQQQPSLPKGINSVP